MPEIQEIIAQLKEHPAADVASALQKEAPEHYQHVYQKGFSTAHADAKQKLEAKDAELAAIQQERDDAKGALESERQKAPDAEAVRQQYEDRLKALKQEKDEAVAQATERVKAVHKRRFQSDLKAALIAEGVDPDYASEVLVQKYEGRIQPAEDGAVKVLDDDGMTPISAADGELARVFARKVKAAVDPKWIASSADGGAGSTAGGKGGTTAYDPAAVGRQMAERQKAAAQDSELAFR